MKNLFLIAMACISTVAYSQIDLGVKGGLNFDSNGEINFQEIGDAAQNISEGGDASIGFHIGGYAKINFSSIYLRPELVFTRTTSQYNVGGSDADLKISKIDAPILLGVKVIGPVSVFAGPSFQYLLSDDFDLDNVTVSDVDKDLTVGFNVGAALTFGNLGVDVRYERGFSENEANFIGNNFSQDFNNRIDTRPSQLIFSLFVKL